MEIDDFINSVLKRSPQHNCLYHFTDRTNLPVIRQSGGLFSREMLNLCGIDVPSSGGNQWSMEADQRCGMDRFVHLCCTRGHPMVHSARNEGRLADPVWLEIAPEVLLSDGVQITLEVSNKAGVIPLNVEAALDAMDLEVLYTRMPWADPTVNARLQIAEKYEILIPARVALDHIRNANG